MNNLKFLLFFIFVSLLVSNENCYSQDSNLVFQKVIPFKTVSFSVNNIGELFLINEDDQLKKIDSKGDSVGVFNEVARYGKLTFVEARDPWRTLLFYKDYSTILLLDKYLNVVTNINLRKNNLLKIEAVATSYDNNIWVYDGQNEKLKKIDQNGSTLLESSDLRQLVNEIPSAGIIKDRDRFVYLYDRLKGLYVFDYYGSFKNKYDFLNWRDFEVIGNYIYGFDDKFLYRYQIGTLALEKYNLPPGILPYKDVKIANNKIFFLHNDLVQIFELKK